MSTALGVDWTNNHWLCLEHRPHQTAPHPETYDTIADLWDAYDDGHDISRLCIDIPIGLPTGPDERAVDKHCCSHLTRTFTVFRVPIREALEADTPTEANQIAPAPSPRTPQPSSRQSLNPVSTSYPPTDRPPDQ